MILERILYSVLRKCIYIFVFSLMLPFLLLFQGCSFMEKVSDKSSSESADESSDDKENIKITYLNVGKADCIIIKSRESCVIIDTGTSDTAEDVADYLENENISRIDALFITHFDKDHVGGASCIISEFDVENVYTTYRVKESDEINAYDKAMEEKALTETVVTDKTVFDIDDVSYTVYPPENDDYDEDESNNSSLIIMAQYENNRFLFMGDAEEERIDEALSYDLSCDVIKMPHHGKKEDNTKDLISRANPSYAVITSSDEDKESKKVLKWLDNKGVSVYLTRLGSVYMVSDGENITCTQE